MNFLKTRELELKDAEYMLEWMKDEGTKKVFKFNFNNMTLQDTQNFIINSREDNTNCHLAVVDENDDVKTAGDYGENQLQIAVCQFQIVVHHQVCGNQAAAEIHGDQKEEQNQFRMA